MRRAAEGAAAKRGALLALAITLAACGPPPIETCQLRCESECPPGWTCMGGYCVRPGSSACPAGGGDAGVDAPLSDADVQDGDVADGVADGAANDGIVTPPDARRDSFSPPPDARRDGPVIITPDGPCVPMDGGLAPCF